MPFRHEKHLYYLKNGIEITSEFIFPGEMAVSFGSFLKRQPSSDFIQTIDKTKVMLIPFSLFGSGLTVLNQVSS
jgi:hypothetical protein